MKKIFFAATFILISLVASAVPAYPGRIVFNQPGRDISVNIYLKGDEKVHWAETEDGYSLLHGDDGALYYAMRDSKGNMVISSHLATETDARSEEVELFLKETPKHIHFSQSQVDAMLDIWEKIENTKSGPKMMSEVVGEKKFLVILFGFQDRHMHFNKRAFQLLFNQVNYSINNATGSVHDYYKDVSGGLFSLTVDVAGPYVGAHEMAYYGNSDYGSQAFAREAVDSAAKDVDFSEYDNDGDGYIDGVHIIFAGYGEEAGASSDAIWSHKWNIFNPPTYNNTVVDVYSCSPELSGNMDLHLTRIGVICHELGHVFGSPDYYDTDYSGSGGEYPGLGKWDIMSSGSWNNNGTTPAQHNPYTKMYIYNWATCDTINNNNGTLVIDAAERSSVDFHRVNTTTEGDFFLLENRQRLKWDAYIPGHGMLVYHAHPNAYGRNVSNRMHPQQLYIFAESSVIDTFPKPAPSSYGLLNSSETPYPRANGNNDSLTDNSVPWFRPWSKVPNGVTLRNISESSENGMIYLVVNNGSPNPQNVNAEAISNQSIELEWERYGDYNTLVVIDDGSGIFGTPNGILNIGDTVDGGGIVVYKGSASNCLVDNLNRGQQYCFKIFSNWHASNYSDGVMVCATTLDCDNTEWMTEDFDNIEYGELPECWRGDWSVATQNGNKVLTCSGESWNSVICRPITFDTTKSTVLKFKYSFIGKCDENITLRVEYRKRPSSDWTEVKSDSWRFGIATWNEAYIQLDDAGDYSLIRFSALTNENASVSIDDIELVNGNLLYASCDDNGNITPHGFNIVSTGASITYTITSLKGYILDKIELDGNIVDDTLFTINENGAITYTLYNIDAPHNIYAEFVINADIYSPEKNNLKVWPNPTTQQISITYPIDTEAILYDILGREIKRTKIENGNGTIWLENIEKGIYILRCNTVSIKVVKE